MLIYTLPAENVANNATIVLALGTADVENPLIHLTDGDPAVAFITTDSLGIEVTLDFGSPQRVDLCCIPMHGIPAGTAVKLQGNDTDTWATPDVDGSIIIDPFKGSGFPEVAFLDVTGVTGGVTGYTVGGERWWRLLVPSHGGITKVGDFQLWTTKRTLATHVSWGFERNGRRHVASHTRVDGGLHVYDYQTELRALRGQIPAESADHDLLEALHDAAFGSFKPFLVQGALSHDAGTEAMYVRFPDPAFVRRFPNFGRADVPFEVDEVSRGMPL